MIRKILSGLCLALVISACQPSNSGSHGHSHGGHSHDAHGGHGADAHDDHSTVSLTLYNENTELFVEFESLMLDHTAKFLAHLTNLKTYKPYTEGKLTVSLIKGKKGIRSSVDAPSRPGIFTPTLQPKSAGVYTLVFDVESKYGKERFTAKNIKVYKNHEEADADMASHEDEGETSFLKEQAWKIDFATSAVNKGPFQQIIKTTGSLLPSVSMEKQVVAQTSGTVHFQSNDIVAGKTVSKNDPLFYISGKGLAENNIATRYTKAKTDLEKAEADYERAKTLREDQIVSEKDYIEAKSNFENAKIKYNSISKNFNSKGLNVVSPTNGYVCDIYINEGQYVEKGEVLAKVDKGSKLLLKADVYQKHLSELSRIQSANFKLPYRNSVFSTDELNGRLIAYGKDIHKEDYTTPLYFEIDIKPELYSGSFVEVYLQSESTKEVLYIDKSAILEDQGLKYVFVQTGGESYSKRFITIGLDNGRQVEIKSGLKAGERIVSEGAYFVKLASLAGALPAHSHEH